MDSNFRTILEDAVNKQRFKIDDCIAFESYLDDFTKLACKKNKKPDLLQKNTKLLEEQLSEILFLSNLLTTIYPPQKLKLIGLNN